MAGEWDVVDETPVRRKAAQAANEWDVVAEAPVAGLPLLGEPLSAASEDAVSDLIGIERRERSTPGDLSDLFLRGVVGLPQLAADVLQLPANVVDALGRSVGMDPTQVPALYGARQVLGAIDDAADYLPEQMDRAGIGAPSVSGGQLVESLNPYANANRREAADAFGDGAGYTPLTLGDRIGNVGRFALEQSVRSSPDMAAAVVATPAYIAGRANQIAENRAANDNRTSPTLGDLGVAGVAAPIEALLERFTTMRLLPGGTSLATPGILPALARIAKELGIQGSLGGVEELAPYLAETAGTELGATGQGALEAFTGGTVAEGALGGVAQGGKEAINAIGPDGRRVRPEAPVAPAAPRADTPPSTAINPAPALGDDAELDALLLRNLPPEVVEGVLGDPNPAPAAPTPTPAGEVPERASLPAQDLVAEIAARMRQSAQERAAQSADVPRARTVPPSSQDTAAPAAPTTPAAEDVQASAAERLPAAGADLGTLYQRGNGRNNSSAQALRMPDGSWLVRHRKTGQWQPWERRDTFDPSPAFGYRETGMAGGAVNVPGIGRVPVQQLEQQAQKREFNPLLDLIANSGGITRADAARFGVDPAMLNLRRGIKPLFSDKGVSLDDLRQTLLDDNYLPPEDPNAPPRTDLNDVWELVSRALAGEPVAAMDDPRMADFLASREEDRFGPEDTDADHDPDDDLARWFDEASPDEPIMAGDEAEAMSIAELAERAATSGAEDFDIAPFAGESDGAYAARLWQLIQQQEARRGPDREAEAGDLREGVQRREGREAAAVAEEQPSLFAGPTAREEVAAERRRRDDRRDGRTGTETPSFSGTPLGAGPLPAQAELETAELPAQDVADYGNTRALPSAGEPGRVASRSDAAGRGASALRGQLDLFVATRGNEPPGEGREPAVKLDRAKLRQSARLVQTGQFRSGIRKVGTLADAAHILAPLRKSAQERFMVLALDADDRPLAVMQHTVGTIDQSLVDTGAVFGGIAAVPGVRSVVFAHNHPSGNPQPSTADLVLDRRLLDLFNGSGIKVRGSIILQPGRRTFTTYGEFGSTFSSSGADTGRSIVPAARRESVPMVERQLRRVQPVVGRVAASSPDTAQQLVRSYRQESPAGLILLNTQHEVVGFLPIDPRGMKTLRTGDRETSHAALVQAAVEANTAAAIAYGDDAEIAGLQNAMRAMRAADIRALDIITFDGDTPTSLAQHGKSVGDGPLESVEPTFHSAALRAVEQGKGAPKRADATAWKGWLDGAQRRGEFRQGERDWLGLDAWLDGRATTTRDELAEFVRANAVQVQDVVLGAPEGEARLERQKELMRRLGMEFGVQASDNGDGTFDLINLSDDPVDRASLPPEAERLYAEWEALETQQQQEGGEAKFASYQLPGGENYRELLLTLPSAAREVASETRFRVRVWIDGMDRVEFATQPQIDSMARRGIRHEVIGPVVNRTDSDFTSSHFDQPNILAHVRFNERTDADGKRVLFLEEIQSDWHQAGRKQGYGGKEWQVQKQWPDGWRFVGSFPTQSEAKAWLDANTVEGNFRVQQEAGAIPDAPFKATDEWAMLAFKRMVRWAAEHGFDRIAWTTGEQQAARYDLSKQVDNIIVAPRPDAERRVALTMKGGTTIVFDVDRAGVLGNLSNHNADLRGKSLDEVVGKEMAEKIMAVEERQDFTGDGLKVGGQGMTAFYDRILPSAVNKWAKRFGGRVGVTSLSSPGNDGYWINRVPSQNEWHVMDGDEIVSRHTSHGQAMAEAERLGAASRARTKSDAVHALDLTPAMRDAALAGQPLFDQQATELADDDLTDDERRVLRRSSPAERNALATLRAESARERGESDASLLRDAVRKAVGDSPVRVAYTRGMAGLKGLVKDGYIQQLEDRQRLRGTKMRTSGLYIPGDQTIDGDPLVVLFTDVVNTPGLAAFTAAHEIAGHHGLRALLGADLDKALSIAEQNSTVKAVADSMMRRRKMAPNKRLLAIEEALADLAAATRTGDYGTIAERHGVEVPTAQRKTLAGAIARFIERVKALFSRRGVSFTDAQVHDLLADAWRAGQGQAATGGADTLSSMEPDDDYRGEHAAPMKDSGAPAHDVTGGGDFYPNDVYSANGLRYYGTGEDVMDREAYATIQRLHGKPNAYVTIYRAVPKTVKAKIKAGDWVTIVRRYATDHGRGALNGDFKIQEKLVRANEIFTNGDSWLEWGYDPQPLDQEYEAAKRARRAAKAAASESEPLESTDDQTDTPEFRRWFGDSKVVDSEGKPLVVYHGTGDNFDVFESGSPNKKDGGWLGEGFYFSDSQDVANHYSTAKPGETPNVMPVYLALKNPAYKDGMGAKERLMFADLRGDKKKLRAETARLRAKGHDGIIWHPGYKDAPTEYVVFDPEQIKSATGNRGTFDPDNPSILESVDYTPEQSAALAKAGLPVDRRTTLQRVRDGLREEWHKVRDAARDSDALKQAIFDKFHGLRMAEARVGLTDPAVSPYIAARMSAGLGSTMESLLLYGAPKWDNGVLAIDENTVGLLDALKPVEGSVDEFLGWMVGRRAKLLKAQGRENNLSDGDIDALLSLASGREQAFQKAAKEYLKVKTAVLDVAEQAGLIDPEARAAWDHAEYIPFYRAENESVIGPGTRKGLAGQSSGIRTLKGGEQALADPLANIVRNFTRLLDSAGKNRATLLAVDQLGEAFFTKAQREFQPATIPLDQVKRHLAEQGVSEQAIAGMPNAALKGVARMLSIVPPTGEDVVRVMRAGKAEYYTVLDPLVLRALTAFKQANKNLAIKPFIFFKRLLTTGVTTTGDFVLANFGRDSGSAWVLSDDRFRPGWDSIRGVVNTLRNDKTNREMMMAGGTFLGGQFYGGDPDSAAAALRRALRQKGLSSREIEGFVGTVARAPLHLWDGWLKLSGGVENANRRAVYDAAIRAGRSKLEAAYMARDLMDFAMQGDAAWVQFFADVLPFFNARLQGLYKLGRRAGTKEGKRAIVLRGGVIALASVGLMAWNLAMHGDAYDELEEWDKDAYWHIAPGTEYHIRIPKPFEIGIAFATIPERIMAAIQHARTDGESGDRPAATFDSALRAITGTLAMNPIPQGALPIVEQWANKRFFSGRPIENMGDDKLLPEAREEWFTSDTAKLIADVAGNKTGLSAKRIEHLWNGYTGGLGAYLLDSFDWVVRQVKDAPERPEMALRDFPLVGRFARGANPPPNPKSVGEFYDLLARAEEIEGTIKEYYARSGNPDMQGEDIGERAFELMEEHRWLLGETYNSRRLKAGIGFEHVRDMRKVRSKLSDLRQEADDVAMSKSLSAHDKRVRLDEIAAKRAKLARDMVRKIRASERREGEGEGAAPAGVRRSSLPESRRAEYVGIGKGGRATPAPAVLKGARNAPKMVMVGSWAELPEPVREGFDKGANGLFDPESKKVYVLMGMPEKEATFVAYHEIAGHYGLQGALGDDYESVLNRAMDNPTVKKLSEAMLTTGYHDTPNRLARVEEALAELAAARRTGDYDHLERTRGVKIPAAARPGLEGMLSRVVQLTKRKLADLIGDEPKAYSDEQVYGLIEDAWQYVETGD